MKLIISLYFLLSFAYCHSQNKSKLPETQFNTNNVEDSTINYRIINIDTIENIYIFFAKKGKSIYKIVSIQDSIPCLNSIKEGKCYSLVLKSVFPENQGHKSRIQALRYGSLRIPLEGENGIIWDLFYIQNIRELCNQLDLQIPSDTLAILR